MAEIVSGLFGLDPLQIRRQEEQQRQFFANQFAQTYVDPYEQANALRGGMVGNALSGFLGGLFGLQSPELKRATTLESILQQTQQEVGSTDPAVLYPALQKRLAEAGFGREAFQVGQSGVAAIAEARKTNADIESKEAMNKYYGQLGSVQELTAQAKELELQGQVAYGGLTAYTKAKDPAVKTKVWENTLKGLQARGFDTTELETLPWEQREAALESIVDSSDSSANRTKQEVAALKAGFEREKFISQLNIKERELALQIEKAKSASELAQAKLELSKNKSNDSVMQGMLKLIEKQERDIAFSGNDQAIKNINSEQKTVEIEDYIKKRLDLPSEYQAEALSYYKNKLATYLSKVDRNGYPLYTPFEAEEEAKKDMEKAITGEEGFFSDKRKFTPEKTKTKPEPGSANKRVTYDKNGKLIVEEN